MTDLWFHTHAHSEFSALDGMPKVSAMIERVKANGQPALALTDHGVMSGSFQLYRQCLKAGVVPFPGQEFYLVSDVKLNPKLTQRYHVGMMALSETGYTTLVKLSSLGHQRDRYNRKPRIDYGDLAELADAGLTQHVALTSGCYFGAPIQALVTKGEAACEQALGIYAKYFPGTFYVELQHHHTDHGDGWTDDLVIEALVSIAQRRGWPTLITQDAHYCDMRHKPVHDMMKLLSLHGADPGDVGFPGDSYHLATTDWVQKHYSESVWSDAATSNVALLDGWELDIPPLDTYSFHMPTTVAKPDVELRKRAMAHPAIIDGPYRERIEAELGVIKDTGFASYFLLVQEIVRWAQSQGILVMARGSANGSLVCYALGITQVDPIQWKLLFERFLTRDRSKPPDIDLDIEDTQRGAVVEWTGRKHDICQIGTFTTLGIDDEGKGSILQTFLTWARRNVPDWHRRYGRIETMDDLAQVDPDITKLLRKLSAMKVRRSAGTHAAGFVISAPTLPFRDYVPTMLIPSSGSVVTQMMMDDLEDAGIIKVDLLGLRSLSTIKQCMSNLGRDTAGADPLGWIPLDDADVLRSIRKGDTVGVFQLEGYTARRGAQELGVKSVYDIILVMALYRTATLASGYTEMFLNRRGRRAVRKYPNAAFRKHMQETYGVAVFQEQVISTMAEMGLGVESLNTLLKAVKVKHSKQGKAEASQRLFDQAKRQFEELCSKRFPEMTAADVDQAWAAVEGFSAYGFNRAHATAYGLMAYRMAWLKQYHPLEFMSAVLTTTAGTKKEATYVSEARRMGIRLLSADVNVSGALWTLDHQRHAVRRGLTTIHGVGDAVAAEVEQHAPYSSLDDLVARTSRRIVNKGKIELLRTAGALRSIGEKP